MESPGALTGHAGKSRESTLARQRGGRGMALSLTHYQCVALGRIEYNTTHDDATCFLA